MDERLGSKKKRTKYRYEPLNEARNEIRLMTLHPGDFTADIKISIQKVSLVPENPPVYEALSYVWGLAKDLVHIQFGHRTLAITRNLAEALLYLRYRDRPCKLWIDAICVNQWNLQERGHQVTRMADIYRLADRVVVWLGPEKSHSRWGMKILEQLSSKIKIDWGTSEMKPASKEAKTHWSDKKRRLPYTEKQLLAIKEVLDHPWFGRLWIQQELRLANCRAVFMCGSDTISWRSLRKAIHCLYFKRWLNFWNRSLSEFHEWFEVLYDLTGNTSTFSFLDIMQKTKHCKCLDPRDRVYAILSLLNETEKCMDLEPDYGKTTSQVYQDVALRYIAHGETLDILKYSLFKNKPSDMPTWVPDWKFTYMIKAFPWSQAGGDSLSKTNYRGAGVLSATGTHSATVLQSLQMSYVSDKTMFEKIRNAAPNDTLRSSYVGGGSLFAAYCRTICGNRFADTYWPISKDWPRLGQSLDFLFPILQGAKPRQTKGFHGTEANRFVDQLNHYLRGKSVIKTREGYIGLAPQEALPGDRVCILLGCDVPLLLRPAQNHRFQVVGQCYVHGLMYGEAFLGPLPEHYQVVIAFEDKAYHLRFLNNRTREIQKNDPRRGSPRNDEPHPRLTPELIEKRGVKLQTFDLI